MEQMMAVLVGVLYATGIYMILRRSIGRLVLGVALLSNAANLLILTASGLVRGRPPLVPEHSAVPPGPVGDPLPQALILTAIVISFGVIAFTLVLIHRATEIAGTDDVDRFTMSDSARGDPP
jgi:multicomponent Na+:H+ antiporter subunit C